MKLNYSENLVPMDKKAFLIFILLLNPSLSRSQLSDLFIKPAVNFANLLTGNYFNKDGNNERQPQSQNNQIINYEQPNYQTNHQPQSNYQPQQNYQPQPSYQSSMCDGLWSYQSDYTGNFGLLSIPNPSYEKNVLRITLSLAAKLSSVIFEPLFIFSSQVFL